MAEVGQAWVTVIPSAKGFGKATEKQVSGDLGSAGKSIGSKFGTALKVGGMAALGGLAAGGALIKSAFGEAQDAAKVGAQTAAVIKSTGGVAGVTAKHVDKLSTAISEKIGVDDEAIAAGQNMLLTFSKVRNEVGKGNDIFDRATVTASDMAAAFGGDAVSNSKMLGKALNDPIKGVSALTRVGVSFTQQQKDQIAALQESGNVLGAQKIILGEVEKQTAGSAEAQATAADKMGVAWGNLQEKLGTALMPMFERVFGFVTSSVIPGAERLGATLSQNLGPIISRVGGFIQSHLLPAIQSLAQWVMSNLVPAFRDLAADVMPLMGDAMTRVKSAFSDAQPFFSLLGKIVVNVLIPMLGKLAKVVLPVLGQALAGIGKILGAIGKAGTWLWNNALQPVFKFLVQAIAKALSLFGKMLQVLGKAPGMEWVGNLGDDLVAAANKADSLADGIDKIDTRKTVNIDIFQNVHTRRSGGAGFGAVPGLASGGVVTRPTLALVGEGRESEAVLPLSKLSSMLAAARSSSGGPAGGGKYAIQITNWATGTGYMEQIADGRIAGQFDLVDEQRRARR